MEYNTEPSIKYMDFNTFKFLVNSVEILINNKVEFDKNFQRMLGGDTYISSELNLNIVEDIENYLTEHFNDNDNKWVSYLLWEVNTNPDINLVININDEPYVASTEVIYDILIGKI